MSDHKPFVTVTQGMRGYFAVLMMWNKDHGGFYEPFNSSDFSSDTVGPAEEDAKAWAAAEDIEYQPSSFTEKS